MAKAKKKTSHIYAKVGIETSIEIQANSLEDALEQSKSLKIGEFVEIIGEHNDSEMKITGVYEEHSPIELG